MNRIVRIPKCGIEINDFHDNDVCLECLKKNGIKRYNNIVCELTGGACRIGCELNENFEVYACSDKSKTSRNFKLEFDLLVDMVPYLPSLLKELNKNIEAEYEGRFRKFIHNISTINARCIQVFELLEFNRLGKDAKIAIKNAKTIIKNNLGKTAQSLFDLMKFESMIKVEMHVFEQMYKKKGQVSEKDYHNIRDVIMLTLHRFFYDFNQKGVFVNVEENYDKVYLNYESFSCSLYYVIENATKYVKPNSEAQVVFLNNKSEYCIAISMYSHYLSENDRHHIFEEGYSGEYAKKLGLNGHGLGMFRAKKLLSDDGASIEFDYGNCKEMCENIYYALNTITIRIPILPEKPVK